MSVGIDPSSQKLAMVIGDSEQDVELLTVKFAPGPAHRPLACAEAHEVMTQLMLHYLIRQVGIEAPVVGRGGVSSTIPQVLVQGAVQAAIGPWAPLHVVNNSHWKKTVVGKGNATKPEVMAYVKTQHRSVYDRLPVNRVGDRDQDLADAFCIYLYMIRSGTDAG